MPFYFYLPFHFHFAVSPSHFYLPLYFCFTVPFFTCRSIFILPLNAVLFLFTFPFCSPFHVLLSRPPLSQRHGGRHSRSIFYSLFYFHFAVKRRSIFIYLSIFICRSMCCCDGRRAAVTVARRPSQRHGKQN